jgi:hypothetical protein
MKTLLIALSLVAASLFNTVNAADVTDNPQVIAAFQSRFGKATEVRWTEAGAFWKVSFTLDGMVSDAWYNTDGALVAVTRQQSVDSLPASLRTSLDLQGRWVSGLMEVQSQEGSTWYITLEDANRTVVFRSVAGRKWSRFEQSTKL